VSATFDILRDVHPDDISSLETDRGSPQLASTPSAQSTHAGSAETLGARITRPAFAPAPHAWNPREFAEQQILSLVHRVFFPGWPRPCRQVVFTSADGYSDAGFTCAHVGQMMAKRLPGTVFVIETDQNDTAVEKALNHREPLELLPIGKSSKCGRRVHENLWLLRSTEFFEEQTRSLDWIRSRLGELRREFDYAVIHAPAVGACGETGLLGQIADGVILVLDERRTRRATAREAKAVLQAANARLLGVVLNERQFPIPESIYRKL
jgi:protein-tyrosine kinase